MKMVTFPVALLLASCATLPAAPRYDRLVRGGTIVDGSGGAPFTGDVGIRGDRIVAVAPHLDGTAARTIDAHGLAVAPGFVNMLSWAGDALIEDGAGESDIRQGVTLEVMGEGWSEGPLNDKMIADSLKQQGDLKHPISWHTLREYQAFMERRGIAPNIASFVGATTVRMHELGEDDVDPSPAQLAAMQNLVRAAMNEGAMGLGSSLIYAPATYAETPELIALATASAACGGRYISHIRDEGRRLIESIDELVSIARAAHGGAEIYHYKQAGRDNWGKLDVAIARVEDARRAGLDVTADMYNYPASATGLDAAMPTWVQAGGYDAWAKRLADPATRHRVLAEMRSGTTDWVSGITDAGGGGGVMLVGLKNPALKHYTGRTLADVAKERGVSVEDAAIDLVIADGSRVEVVYFEMNEANVARQVALPWMSFGSDAEASAPRGKFLLSSTHPRAYGNVARLLGKYVRDEKRLSLAEAVRKLTSLPTSNLGLTDRGLVRPGMIADLAIFDPATIADRATFEQPQQFAVGMRHVLVNGRAVLSEGEMTGERPGRAVLGPGTGRCPQH